MEPSNRAWWDEVTARHLGSSYYDVAGFLAGKSSLTETEVSLLGNVSGRRILHLMCHFGLDTLSIARLGANVVGLDFSAASIHAANELAKKSGLSSQSAFVVADVHELASHVRGQFDTVFTSTGVLEWLHDLDRWSRGIAAVLRPGGRCVIFEIHPFSLIFDELATDGVRVSNDYFEGWRGLSVFNQTDYVDRAFVPEAVRTKRLWRLEQVVIALMDAGLRMVDFREYPFSTYQALPILQRGADGLWRFPPHHPSLPLYFSLVTEK